MSIHVPLFSPFHFKIKTYVLLVLRSSTGALACRSDTLAGEGGRPTDDEKTVGSERRDMCQHMSGHSLPSTFLLPSTTLELILCQVEKSKLREWDGHSRSGWFLCEVAQTQINKQKQSPCLKKLVHALLARACVLHVELRTIL